MKILQLTFGIFSLTFILSANATNPVVQQKNPQQRPLLAATCTATNCESCWDQCTKSDDCGTGHKCISTTCGNRCVKDTAD